MCSWVWPRPRSSRAMRPDSMSQNQAVISHPSGSAPWQLASWRGRDRVGSCWSSVETRARNATATRLPAVRLAGVVGFDGGRRFDGWLGYRDALSRVAPWSRWYRWWSCAGWKAGRPSVEPVCWLGDDHAARASSSWCLSLPCWLSAHLSTSLIASSWTSARCTASGPLTRTISTELVSRLGAAGGERAALCFLAGGACSSLATARGLRPTRRNCPRRRRSPDVGAGHDRLTGRD
jgi:hypothetical protein